MTIKNLYGNVTGTSNLTSIQVSTAHNAATAVATVSAVNTSLDIGSQMSVIMGYVGNNAKVFQGYVKNIDINDKTGIYEITAQDELSRAVDFFIASSTPDNPFKRKNIQAEFLIRDVLSLAGITNYSYDPTSFTFATQGELEVNLIGAYDFCKQISDILAWHIYADENGQVHFVNRKPYIVGGDTPSVTITDSVILSAVEDKADTDLRNRIVVYGKGSVAATAQASSPYLPSGFYKSTVLATDIIDSNTNAQLAANYNLALLNRLNESVNVQIEGNPNIFARDIVHLEESILNINADYYAYAVEHSWGPGGYTTGLVLRK